MKTGNIHFTSKESKTFSISVSNILLNANALIATNLTKLPVSSELKLNKITNITGTPFNQIQPKKQHLTSKETYQVPRSDRTTQSQTPQKTKTQ